MDNNDKKIERVEVTLKINFPKPITPEEAREFVNEMDYDIKDLTGKFSDRSDGTMDAEVVADDIDG